MTTIEAKATLLEKVSNLFLIEFKPKNRTSCYIFEEKNGDIMYELLK